MFIHPISYSGNTLNQVAADIMLTDVVKIPITYTLLDLAKLVREHRMPSFPVVNGAIPFAF